MSAGMWIKKARLPCWRKLTDLPHAVGNVTVVHPFKRSFLLIVGQSDPIEPLRTNTRLLLKIKNKYVYRFLGHAPLNLTTALLWIHATYLLSVSVLVSVSGCVNRVFHNHTNYAMLALLPTLYSHIFAVFSFVCSK